MKKKICSILAVVLFFTSLLLSYAEGETIVAKNYDNYTLDECINVAMENNLTIKQIRHELKISEFNKKRTNKNTKNILDNDDTLSDKWNSYYKGKKEAEGIKKNLDGLNQALQNSEDPTKTLEDIKNSIDEDTYKLLKSKGNDKTAINQAIEGMKKEIDNQSQQALNRLQAGKQELDDANKEANSVLSMNLGITTNVKLGIKSTTELMDVIADITYDITKAGYEISKKQIAMLVEKNYYEVLKMKKIANVKQKSLDRANGQFEIIKNAYDEGLRAKDDLLLAKSQVELMKADLEKAISDEKNAKIDLKNTLNIPLVANIAIAEINLSAENIPSLEDGIKQGLEKRLEIQQAMGQYIIDSLNHELTARTYPDITNQYKEALYKKEYSNIKLEIQKKEVEADIRKSYETMVATSKMYEHVRNSVEQMQANLQIATYRYNEGIGYGSSSLKSINSEELGGTIMEVLSASEKLAEVEEKVVAIEHAKNLSITQYLNSIGQY